ncbi:MAG: hypothetical protein R3C44_22280 [Chloroflexota bacterium]
MTVLALAAFALAACGGQAQQAVQEVAPTVAAAVEEVAPTVEAAAVEEAATEAAVEEAPTEEVLRGGPTEEAPAEEASTEEMSGDRIPVRWFIGLGTGAQEAQVEREEAVVAAFNESQDEIELTIELVQNEVARDAWRR